MTVTHTESAPEAQGDQGSDRSLMRDRYHEAAKAVAYGHPFPGPESLELLVRDDPAFRNLVAKYRGAL